MKNIDYLLSALCKVSSEGIYDNQVTIGKGSGMFLLPYLVLTAWHNIIGQKSSNIVFENMHGDQTSMKRRKDGGIHFKDVSSDLVVIELEEDIGPSGYTSFATPFNTHQNSENCHILTYFSEDPDRVHVGSYPSRLNYLYTMTARHQDMCVNIVGRNQIQSSNLSYFTSHFQAGAGHSGSPIVNDEGRLVSVFSGIASSNEEELKSSKFDRGKIVEREVIYFGADTDKFSKFMHQVHS